MIREAFLDKIKDGFSQFDEFRKEYEQTFSEEYLKECVRLLLDIDALISEAEFEEIKDIGKEESYIQYLSYKIGFKRTILLLESILKNAKKMQKDVEMESYIVEQISKGTSPSRLNSNMELRNRLNKLYSQLDIKVDVADVSDIEAAIEQIATSFEELYGIKIIFSNKVRALTQINPESPEMIHAKKELLIRFHHYEEQLLNHITFIVTKCIHTLKALEYFKRYQDIRDKIEFAFKNNKAISLKAVIKKVLGTAYKEDKPLGINYENPSDTFEKEAYEVAKILRFPPKFVDVVTFLIRLIEFVKHEYDKRNDSTYHAIEHTAQNLITSIRLYKTYGKLRNLTMMDFFISCVSSLFHDTGYFYDHFSDIKGHYLSSMHHVGHEMLSIQYARHVLYYHKDEILFLFPGMNFDVFINSVGNVISGTQLEKPAFNENSDIHLLRIIRAADLLEMCSENYVDWLIPLFIDNRIGAPEKKWPETIMTLIRDTYSFMNNSNYVKLRVDPMMKYLVDYPQYTINRDATSKNVKRFYKYMEDKKLELHAVLTKTQNLLS